jgi:osomolarity two-component system sensor histidine kinase SLN1
MDLPVHVRADLSQQETNVQQCLNSGMDFFLSKPIRRSAIRHVLERYRLFINKEIVEKRAPTTGESMGSGIASSAQLRSKSNDPEGTCEA